MCALEERPAQSLRRRGEMLPRSPITLRESVGCQAMQWSKQEDMSGSTGMPESWDEAQLKKADPVVLHVADDDVPAGQLRGRALDTASWEPVQLETALGAAEERLWPRGQRQADMPDEERTKDCCACQGWGKPDIKGARDPAAQSGTRSDRRGPIGPRFSHCRVHKP